MCKVLNASIVGTNHENSVYCGRPSKYGNPFIIGKDGNRKQVLEKYHVWIWNQKDLIKDIKLNLKGKNLICWCAPKACHCDLLLIIANENILI